MEKRGTALIGIGIGTGENRATEAALQAISSPLLETSIDGATDAIINVTGGNNLTLFEVEEAADAVRNSAKTDMNTIFGAVINENLNDEIIVTVIATGFDKKGEKEQEEVKTETNSQPSIVYDSDNDTDDEGDDMIPSFLRRRGSF